MRTRSLAVAGVLGIVASLALAGPAVAAEGSNCWGVVVDRRPAPTAGSGAHSSSFDEPRLGIGNVARLFNVEGPGGLGTLLASIDGNDATHC